MNNTTLLASAAGLIIIGGLVYYVAQPSTSSVVINTATSTPIVTENPLPVVTVQEAGAPLTVTSADVTTNEFAAAVSGNVTPRGFFTNYWFEYGITENLGSKTGVQNIGSGYTAITAPGYITGLARNTKYYFRLVAENQYGKIAGNQHTFTTNVGNPAPVGSLPTIKTTGGSTISRTTADINAEVTPNQSTTQYWFEYGKTGDLGRTSSLQTISNTSPKTQVSFSLTDLSPATSYYYRVNAQNQWGTVNGQTVMFRTAGPADTSKPLADTNQALNIRSTSATLRGVVNPNGVETIYWFEYSTDSLLGSVLLKTTARTSAGADTKEVTLMSNITGLSTNTNYFYRIVAENNLGIAHGDRVAFKTK